MAFGKTRKRPDVGYPMLTPYCVDRASVPRTGRTGSPYSKQKPLNNVIMQVHPSHWGSMKTYVVFHKEPYMPPGDAGAG